jgi:hypothetical protein
VNIILRERPETQQNVTNENAKRRTCILEAVRAARFGRNWHG